MTLLARILRLLQPFADRPEPAGHPFAVDPAWLRAHKAEAEARRRHKPTRQFQKAKADALHAALRGAR